MRKFQKFFQEIAWFHSYAKQRPVKRSIKTKLGDSINNNRTLTVNQAIRYLRISGRFGEAKRLAVVKEVLEPLILSRRVRRKIRRTDAIDMSEFIKAYRVIVMDGRCMRREIGTAIGKIVFNG